MAKKIISPMWAPSNIGQILKHLRIACGINSIYDDPNFGRSLHISLRILSQIESGKRNVSEKEIEDIIYGIKQVSGNKIYEVINQDKIDFYPIELKYIIYHPKINRWSLDDFN